MNVKKSFSDIHEALEFLRIELESLKLAGKNLNRAILMCEESILCLMNNADDKTFSVNVRHFLGNVSIDLTMKGKEFSLSTGLDALASLDVLADDGSAVQNIVMRSFGDNVRYRHTKGYNLIHIKAYRSQYYGLYRTLGALMLAVITGIALRLFATEDISMQINADILSPISTLFMNALKMCAVPVAFFSIVSCITQFTDISELRKIGSKVLEYITLTHVVAVCIGFWIVYILGTGKGAGLTADANANTQAVTMSFLETFMNLMPDNLIKPFINGNMLQLIILAVLIGISAGKSGVRQIRTAFDEMNRLFLGLVTSLMNVMPVIVFCSITSLILTTGIDTIISLAGLFCTVLLGHVLLNVAYWLIILSLRLNPVKFFRKSLPAIITTLMTSSSSAALPDCIKSSRAMGVSTKIYSFSVPVGFAIGKCGLSMYLFTLLLAIINMYGINISFAEIISLGVSTIILVAATPAVSGAGFIALSTLLTKAGCPLELVPLIIGINPLLDMIETTTNVLGSIVSTVSAARSTNMLDMEKYNES